MSETLVNDSRFFAPPYHELARGDLRLLFDPDAPHWIATDPRGAALIRWVDGKATFGTLVVQYAEAYRIDWAKAWLQCHSFFQEALRKGFISTAPFIRAPYPGRAEVLAPHRLTELWLHVTNACNLRCEHCLVSSSPEGIPGGETAFWLEVIDQAKALGAFRFFITGGEPFLRDDIFEIIDHILKQGDETKSELIVLTNAMLFRGDKLKKLSAYDPGRIQLQISLDGPTAEINNPMRGGGTFDATVRGIKEVIGLGFAPTLTTVVNRANVSHLPDMVQLAASLGIKNIHLLLSHHRGRALSSDTLSAPENDVLLAAFKATKRAADQRGITFDNHDALLGKLMGPSGVKVDLSNAGYESLCVYADGEVYPSAALSGIDALRMGRVKDQGLEAIWRKAALAVDLRKGSVQNKAKCKACYLKYLCGGGDLEHSYLYSNRFMGEDPFSDFYEQWILDLLFDHAEAKARQRTPSGYDRPRLLAAMGEEALQEDKPVGTRNVGGFEVALSRSACVLFVDLDHSRRIVSDFYGEAAESPQPELCCPEAYPLDDSAHIPKAVLNISYGCGSPVGLAGIVEGETLVDLGSGGGIDCFIAAKKVGPSGRVIGIDMTDRMLKQAEAAKKVVAQNLGYDNVSFKKGYLEDIPLPDRSTDLVTSNCVINLSPDKKQVFVEIWRILKDFGRIVLSDTLAETPLPEGMKANPRLWGECISGALTENEYLAKLEQAGFYGLSILKKTLWKEVEGYRFYSAVIRGYKFEKKASCTFIGQRATYLGPMQAVVDEEGHLFPRNQAVEVCTDTAAKLQAAPYRQSFAVSQGEAAPDEDGPSDDAACCPPDNCC